MQPVRKFLCDEGHENYEEEFTSREAFLKALKAGALECTCGKPGKHEGILSPPVHTKDRNEIKQLDQARQSVQDQQFEKVGDDFVSEALDIAHGLAPFRPIEGGATEEQAEILRDHGLIVEQVIDTQSPNEPTIKPKEARKLDS